MSGVLIVGGGLAATRCAETLRAEGFDGPLAIAAGERHAPYERPALSKALLAGRRSPASLALRDEGAWESDDIALHLGSPIVRLDLGARRAYAHSGAVLAYDTLVVATGAHPRCHPVLSRIPGVHHLRTLDDARVLQASIAGSGRLAIVGAGLIGAEVASTARELGVAPILIEAGATPLARAFGGEVGTLLAQRWRAAGVEVRTDAAVIGVRRDRRGQVAALALADGTSVECDQVLVCIGAVPTSGLVAYQLEIATDGGIGTDASGRTSAHGVLACGDVASWHRHVSGTGLRAESWTSAAQQAATVARTILGHAGPSDDVPLYAWSDQFGLRLQHVGTGEPWSQVEIEHGDDDFAVRYLARDGRLVAALAANRPRAIAGLRRELAETLVPA